jgi:glutamate racemase
VKELLTARGALGSGGSSAEHKYFVTDVPDRFIEVGTRFLGMPIPHADQVDLSPR